MPKGMAARMAATEQRRVAAAKKSAGRDAKAAERRAALLEVKKTKARENREKALRNMAATRRARQQARQSPRHAARRRLGIPSL